MAFEEKELSLCTHIIYASTGNLRKKRRRAYRDRAIKIFAGAEGSFRGVSSASMVSPCRIRRWKSFVSIVSKQEKGGEVVGPKPKGGRALPGVKERQSEKHAGKQQARNKKREREDVHWTSEGPSDAAGERGR